VFKTSVEAMDVQAFVLLGTRLIELAAACEDIGDLAHGNRARTFPNRS
jgi:hypothetical protein